jgi:hypothetical protein
MFLDSTFCEIFLRHHFDTLNLSTDNNNRAHHEKHSTWKIFWHNYKAFDQEFCDFSIAKQHFGPLYDACTHLNLF